MKRNKVQKEPSREHNGDAGDNAVVIAEPQPRHTELSEQLTAFLPRSVALDAEVLDAAVQIAMFLEDSERVNTQLKVLWGRFEKLLNGNEQEIERKFLLHHFLTEQEALVGFNQTSPIAVEDWKASGRVNSNLRDDSTIAGPARLFGVLPAKQFMTLVRMGFTWDDTGIQGPHGRLTHRFQWCLIAQEVADEGIVLPQGWSVVDFYRNLADERFRTQDGEETIWDFLVDCVVPKEPILEGQVLKSNSARSPEHLNTLLTQSEDWGEYLKSCVPELGQWVDPVPDYQSQVLGKVPDVDLPFTKLFFKRAWQWGITFHHPGNPPA